jgi:hypothetical protein
LTVGPGGQACDTEDIHLSTPRRSLSRSSAPSVNLYQTGGGGASCPICETLYSDVSELRCSTCVAPSGKQCSVCQRPAKRANTVLHALTYVMYIQRYLVGWLCERPRGVHHLLHSNHEKNLYERICRMTYRSIQDKVTKLPISSMYVRPSRLSSATSIYVCGYISKTLNATHDHIHH